MFRVLFLAIAMSAFAAHTHAFEQTNELPKPALPAAEGSAESSAPTVELTVPEADVVEEKGPTISLPGIGKIGTLPKFDFGLELLYGEDEQNTVVEDDQTDSDIRIRGTVKHKF